MILINNNKAILTFVSSVSTSSRIRSESNRLDRNSKNSPAIDSGTVRSDKECFTCRYSDCNNSISFVISSIKCSSSVFQRCTSFARFFKYSIDSNCTLSASL